MKSNSYVYGLLKKRGLDSFCFDKFSWEVTLKDPATEMYARSIYMLKGLTETVVKLLKLSEKEEILLFSVLEETFSNILKYTSLKTKATFSVLIDEKNREVAIVGKNRTNKRYADRFKKTLAIFDENNAADFIKKTLEINEKDPKFSGLGLYTIFENGYSFGLIIDENKEKIECATLAFKSF